MKHICNTMKEYFESINKSIQGDTIFCSDALWEELHKTEESIMNEYNGMRFPMGGFIIWNDKEVLMGSCDPLTKEILSVHTPPDKKGNVTYYYPKHFKSVLKDDSTIKP